MVLVGLVVMHVLPAAHAACPGADPGHAAPAMSTMSGDHGSMAVETPTAVRPAPHAGWHADRAATTTPGMQGMQGTRCMATPPSPGLTALLALLALGLATLAWPTWPRFLAAVVRGPHQRAPPRIGSLLLHDLCVSRM